MRKILAHIGLRRDYFFTLERLCQFLDYRMKPEVLTDETLVKGVPELRLSISEQRFFNQYSPLVTELFEFVQRLIMLVSTIRHDNITGLNCLKSFIQRVVTGELSNPARTYDGNITTEFLKNPGMPCPDGAVAHH
jgi:hypothetical protein